MVGQFRKKSPRKPAKRSKLKVLHRVTIVGSQGTEYEVKVVEGGKARCECLGFKYRQECRHIFDPEVRDLCSQHAPRRRSFATGMASASALALALQPYVAHVEIVGSLRRQRPDVKDIDLIFVPGPMAVAHVTALFRRFGTPVHHGEGMGAIVLPNGLPAQLWPVEEPLVLGAALLHFTGPRDYNISLRIRANRRGWHLSQHGLVDRQTGRLLAGRTEEEVLQALDMPWLPPVMREAHRRSKPGKTTRPDIGYR